MSIGKAIAIIGGVAVGAVGAYNFSSTGCLLGTSCGTDSEAAAASVQTVADGDACPLGCAMEGEAMAASAEMTCCSEESKAIELVAAEGGSCCSSMDKVAAMTVAASTEACCDKGDACCDDCDGACEAGSCPSGGACCEAEQVAQANSCCGQCGEDADCDPSTCTAGDACCKAVASKDD